METQIKQLREKTHMDIPIIILSIMFSLSLNKFQLSVFHVLFVLLIFTTILSKTLMWNLIVYLTKKNNYFIIVSTYIQICLLFAIYYAYGINHSFSWIFYAGYAIFLLLYTLVLSVEVLEFGAAESSFSVKHLWASLMMIIISVFFGFTVILGPYDWGIAILVLFNICIIIALSLLFEVYAITRLSAEPNGSEEGAQ